MCSDRVSLIQSPAMKRSSTSIQSDSSYSVDTCSKKCRELDSLKFLLDCTVCLSRVRPMGEEGAIFTCMNSHVVCYDCQIELKHQNGLDYFDCPICRVRWRGRGHRNLFAAAYLDVEYRNTMINCKYPGCLETGYLSQLTPHEQVCNFRRVNCPAIYSKTCNWQGSVNELTSHIKATNCCRIVMDLAKRPDNEADRICFRGNLTNRQGSSIFSFNRDNQVLTLRSLINGEAIINGEGGNFSKIK